MTGLDIYDWIIIEIAHFDTKFTSNLEIKRDFRSLCHRESVA